MLELRAPLSVLRVNGRVLASFGWQVFCRRLLLGGLLLPAGMANSIRAALAKSSNFSQHFRAEDLLLQQNFLAIQALSQIVWLEFPRAPCGHSRIA